MKNKDLKKVCCIFLLFVIILPLFSNFVSSREGITTENNLESNSYCVPDESNKLESSDYSNYSSGESNCHKIKSPDTCSDYYMLHKKTKTAYPCKTMEASS